MNINKSHFHSLNETIRSIDFEVLETDQLVLFAKTNVDSQILYDCFNDDILECVRFIQLHAKREYIVDLNIQVSDEQAYEFVSSSELTEGVVDKMIRNQLNRFTRIPENDYTEVTDISYHIRTHWSLPQFEELYDESEESSSKTTSSRSSAVYEKRYLHTSIMLDKNFIN